MILYDSLVDRLLYYYWAATVLFSMCHNANALMSL